MPYCSVRDVIANQKLFTAPDEFQIQSVSTTR